MKRIFVLLMLAPFFLQGQTLDEVKKKLEAEDYAGAKAAATKLITQSPSNKEAFSLRGQARMGLEDFYGAIGDFNFALEIDSVFVNAYNFRGEAKLSLADDEGAIPDFDKAIKLNPKFADAGIGVRERESVRRFFVCEVARIEIKVHASLYF